MKQKKCSKKKSWKSCLNVKESPYIKEEQKKNKNGFLKLKGFVVIAHSNIFIKPNMADRISDLPDEVLSHVLSFLPTAAAIATTVLSKRWNELWRSCPSLTFDDSDYFTNTRSKSYSRFVQCVHVAILSRDWHQTVHSLRLSCRSSACDSTNVSVWINTVVQRGVQHLDLCVGKMFNLPSAVPTCKTLVVLKLDHFYIKKIPTVDFPVLKIMHLRNLNFLEHRDFAELVRASPNLEELEAVDLVILFRAAKGSFQYLPKLVRATVPKIDVPLGVLSNAQFLRLDWVMNTWLVISLSFVVHQIKYFLSFLTDGRYSERHLSETRGYCVSQFDSPWIWLCQFYSRLGRGFPNAQVFPQPSNFCHWQGFMS